MLSDFVGCDGACAPTQTTMDTQHSSERTSENSISHSSHFTQTEPRYRRNPPSKKDNLLDREKRNIMKEKKLAVVQSADNAVMAL